MLGFDTAKLEIADTVTVELMNPETGKPLLNPDETPCSIEVHAFHTNKFQAALKKATAHHKEDIEKMSLSEIDELVAKDSKLNSELSKHLIIGHKLIKPDGVQVKDKELQKMLDNPNFAWIGSQLFASVIEKKGKLKN